MIRISSLWLIGLVVTIVIGFGVGPLLNLITRRDRPAPPRGMDAVVWKSIVEVSSGLWLGLFERVLMFAAIVYNAQWLLGGWLAFKVAAKWDAWSNIVRVPDHLGGVDDLDFLRARRQLGSYVFTRFVLGTILSLFAALLGAVFSLGISVD